MEKTELIPMEEIEFDFKKHGYYHMDEMFSIQSSEDLNVEDEFTKKLIEEKNKLLMESCDTYDFKKRLYDFNKRRVKFFDESDMKKQLALKRFVQALPLTESNSRMISACDLEITVIENRKYMTFDEFIIKSRAKKKVTGPRQFRRSEPPFCPKR